MPPEHSICILHNGYDHYENLNPLPIIDVGVNDAAYGDVNADNAMGNYDEYDSDSASISAMDEDDAMDEVEDDDGAAEHIEENNVCDTFEEDVDDITLIALLCLENEFQNIDDDNKDGHGA